jgi:four helix bundle protein
MTHLAVGRIATYRKRWRNLIVRNAGSGMSDYKKLLVWRKAHALALDAHCTAARIRGSQYAPFRSQIIRAALSIPANIVEGREQKTDAGFARFLRIALGSASELEYHLTAAHDIQAISTKSEYQALSSQVVEVRRMLHGLIRRLEAEARKPLKTAKSSRT